MSTPHPQRKPWTKPEKLLLGSIFGILVLVVLVVYGSHYLRPISDLVVPMPTMPHPNAFDYDVAAGNSVQDPDKLEYKVDRAFFNDPPHQYADALAQSTQLVQENQAPLKTLRQGFPYLYQSPPMRSINDKAPYWSHERRLARLLALESHVKAAHSDWNGAVQSDLDAIQLGEQIPHGAVLLGNLVGLACQAIGRRDIWTVVDHLTPTQAKAAALRLETLQSSAVPFADTLQEEKWFGQASMLEQFRRGGLSQIPDPIQSFYLRRYTRYMNQSIANARLPYAAKPLPPDPPRDMVNDLFLPIFDKSRDRAADAQAQNSMLILCFALRSYHVDHRAYPAALNALVPTYISRVPDDPFALSGPLRYKCIGNRYRLYSIGPDGKDDGGKPIFDQTQRSAHRSMRLRHFVLEDSIGDIVAGVNS